MTNLFKGTGIAMVTPFNEDGSVDFSSLEKFTESLISNGVNYLVVMGTTAEAATLSKKEKQEVLKLVIKINNKRLPIIYGIGGNNTAEVVNSLKETNLEGVDAVLSVCPYYNKPTQEGIYQHYKAVADASPKPVVLYNVPGRTGVNMSAETTIRLANDFDNVIAVKEAAGDMSQAMQLVKNKPEGFLVISGDDETTLPLMSVGFDGVTSVVGNAYPKEFSTMVELAGKGEFEEASKIHYRLLDTMVNLFTEGNPAGVKAVLNHKGMMNNVLRLPLVPVSEKTYKILAELDKTVV